MSSHDKLFIHSTVEVQMARKDEQKSKNNGRNRVQGFVFGINLEGTEDVVTEGIKAFTQAMTKSGLIVASLPAPTKPALLDARTTSKTEAETDIEDNEPPAETAQDYDDLPDDDEQETSSNGSTAKRIYNHRAPKFMDELDLTQARKSIEDFMAEKGNPSETNDRYIVVAVWLKEQMQIEELTINHIYTVFDNLGWKSQIPVNHSQPLRDLKTKRHFLTKEKDTGYKVNWQGIQYVAKMGAGK
jgi:hypothetical protein